MKSHFILLIVFLIGLLLLSLFGFYFAIRPFKITSHLTPHNLGVAYEPISFTTSDQVLLRGWYIPSQIKTTKTIILLHGYPADKSNILPAMIFLQRHYNLLLFDFRYFGESEGSYSTIGKNEVLDLLAAIQYLHHRGIHEVGIWGFSMGGSVALMAAHQAPEIKAIVVESPYARLDWMAEEYYRLPLLRYPLSYLTRLWAWLFLRLDIQNVSPVTAVQNLTLPILLIHSEQDDVISFRHALLLQDALKQDANAKVIFNTEGSHGQLMKNYQNIIKTFFDQHL